LETSPKEKIVSSREGKISEVTYEETYCLQGPKLYLVGESEKRQKNSKSSKGNSWPSISSPSTTSFKGTSISGNSASRNHSVQSNQALRNSTLDSKLEPKDPVSIAYVHSRGRPKGDEDTETIFENDSRGKLGSLKSENENESEITSKTSKCQVDVCCTHGKNCELAVKPLDEQFEKTSVSSKQSASSTKTWSTRTSGKTSEVDVCCTHGKNCELAAKPLDEDFEKGSVSSKQSASSTKTWSTRTSDKTSKTSECEIEVCCKHGLECELAVDLQLSEDFGKASVSLNQSFSSFTLDSTSKKSQVDVCCSHGKHCELAAKPLDEKFEKGSISSKKSASSAKTWSTRTSEYPVDVCCTHGKNCELADKPLIADFYKASVPSNQTALTFTLDSTSKKSECQVCCTHGKHCELAANSHPNDDYEKINVSSNQLPPPTKKRSKKKRKSNKKSYRHNEHDLTFKSLNEDYETISIASKELPPPSITGSACTISSIAEIDYDNVNSDQRLEPEFPPSRAPSLQLNLLNTWQLNNGKGPIESSVITAVAPISSENLDRPSIASQVDPIGNSFKLMVAELKVGKIEKLVVIQLLVSLMLIVFSLTLSVSGDTFSSATFSAAILIVFQLLPTIGCILFKSKHVSFVFRLSTQIFTYANVNWALVSWMSASNYKVLLLMAVATLQYGCHCILSYYDYQEKLQRRIKRESCSKNKKNQ